MRHVIVLIAILLHAPFVSADHWPDGRIDGVALIGPCAIDLGMHRTGYGDQWVVTLGTIECAAMPPALWPLRLDHCYVRGSPDLGFVAASPCQVSGGGLALHGRFEESVWSAFTAEWAGFSGAGLGCYDAEAFLEQAPPRCGLTLPEARL